MPERAARVYLAAARGGPQTASELARTTALHRVDTYRYLKWLVSEGLLVMQGQRPGRFVAVPPAELFDRWIGRTREKLDRLRESREHVIEEWRDHLPEAVAGDPRPFAVLEGHLALGRFFSRRVGTARREILLIVPGGGLGHLIDEGALAGLKQARRRGVKVRLVTEIDPANLASAKALAEVADVRSVPAPIPRRAIVFDRDGALVFVTGEEESGSAAKAPVALWSTSPTLLRIAREDHRRLWAAGTTAEERLVELDTADTAVLPVVRGREAEPFRRLREITELGMRAVGVAQLRLNAIELIEAIGAELGRQIARGLEGHDARTLAQSLSNYYRTHTQGSLGLVRERPLTLQVRSCFACTASSPEVGRVLCPRLLRAIFEATLGGRWEVSKPDPRRHAERGCLFTVTPT